MKKNYFSLAILIILYYIYTMPVTKTVTIPADHRLTIDVPLEVPVGDVVLTFTPALEPKKPTLADMRGERIIGLAKGQIWTADDFDAPLEDFKDYM